MRTLRNSKGSALLIALALILLVSAVGMVTLDTATLDIDMSYNRLHEEQAFYVAEAGAKRTLAVLNTDETWRDGFDNVAFGEGAFSVLLTDSADDAALDDTVIVVASGNVDGSNATIEYTLIPAVYNPFAYAMFARDTIDIRNSFVTDSYNSDSGDYSGTNLLDGGDVGSNGNILVANGAVIGGDIATSLLGGSDVNAGATVTGTISDTAPEQEVPLIPQEEFDEAEASSSAPSGMSGSFTYDAATKSLVSSGTVVLNSGVYFFSSIILKNSAVLEVASGAEVSIYVTGDIELKQSSSVNPTGQPKDLIIYSQGDFVLKNSGDIRAVFYNPEGTADLRNSGAFYGSIVADDIVAHNSANFHYDRNLAEIERESTSGFDVVAWCEIY